MKLFKKDKKEIHILTKFALTFVILAIATILIGNILDLSVAYLVSSICLSVAVGLFATRIIMQIFGK